MIVSRIVCMTSIIFSAFMLCIGMLNTSNYPFLLPFSLLGGASIIGLALSERKE